jgi:hypothetical protein
VGVVFLPLELSGKLSCQFNTHGTEVECIEGQWGGNTTTQHKHNCEMRRGENQFCT